jgi:lipoprotein-releasing system permease protein
VRLPYEFALGLRYTRSAKRHAQRNGFISFISALSILGIALGVAALIAVLSVMNGFQKDVRDRMLSVLSHVEILAGRVPLTNWPALIKEARLNPKVIAAAPFVSGQAMLTYEDTVRPILLRGIEPKLEATVAPFVSSFVEGSPAAITSGAFAIAIGYELASQFKLKVGDQLSLIAPQGGGPPGALVPRLRQFKIVGVFRSSHLEFDSNLLLTHLDDAAQLFRIDGVSGVRLLTTDMLSAPQIAGELAQTLSGDLYLSDWTQQNRNWFASILIQKRLMFIILSLIIAVAGFNLVSMLVMTVTDKRADIAILKTLGATPASIMKVFITQGLCIGLLGALLGVILGVLIAGNVGALVAWVEQSMGLQMLPKGVYFIDYLPSDLRLSDVLAVSLTACTLAFVSTLYPSWRASRINPSEALRYE